MPDKREAARYFSDSLSFFSWFRLYLYTSESQLQFVKPVFRNLKKLGIIDERCVLTEKGVDIRNEKMNSGNNLRIYLILWLPALILLTSSTRKNITAAKYRFTKVKKLKQFTPDDKNTGELYDMENDRSETVNLAEKYPEKVKEMASLWEKEVQCKNIE